MRRQNTEAIDILCEECAKRGNTIFNSLCKDEVGTLDQGKTCSNYKKGQILFSERTKPTGVYCLYTGKVKAYKLGADGREQIIHIFSEGDLLGYRTMLAEENYPVTAEVLEDSTICFIPKSSFVNVLQENPAFHQKITKVLSKELGVMVDSITNLAQKTVKERTAMTLLTLKDTYQLNGFDDGPVSINLSRNDLANIVGTATENLIRILHDFKEQNLIKTEGRKITVIDAKGLAQTANLF